MIRFIPLAVLLAAAAMFSPALRASDDAQAIRRICLERIEAFNRHEPPRSGEFTQDADFVNIHGMWRKGPAEIEKRQGERMETVLREARISLLELEVRFVRPDVAIVHQKHEMSGMLGPEGDRLPPHQELSIRVLVKESGKWLTTAFHNTTVRP
ncbi:MAG: SgcJ/EcaC family oxidoreductase [Gammaproteobacteria bacterium]